MTRRTSGLSPASLKPLASLSSVGLVALGVTTVVGPSWASLSVAPAVPGYTYTQSFTSIGSNSFVVPTDVTSLYVQLFGAGGEAGSGFGGGVGTPGGNGAYVTGDLSVTDGEMLNILVGQGGNIATYTYAIGGGGYGGPAYSYGGGGGGGRSAIQMDGADLADAGGGGGGSRYIGGGDGGYNGGGFGGTQTAGGTGGNGLVSYQNGGDGSLYTGGYGGYEGGGGGGGGYYGGGGGGYFEGGGGGSSLTSHLTNAAVTDGGGAAGGVKNFSNGVSGEVIIAYNLNTALGGTQATAIIPTATQTTDNPDGTVTYAFSNIASGTWVDPPATGYVYTTDSGSPLFKDITLPTGTQADPFTITYGGNNQSVSGGGNLNFGTGGIGEFSITGVDPNGGALPVQFDFVGGGVGSFTQQSLAGSPAPEVPESGTLALLGAGLGGLILRARKRSRTGA